MSAGTVLGIIPKSAHGYILSGSQTTCKESRSIFMLHKIRQRLKYQRDVDFRSEINNLYYLVTEWAGFILILRKSPEKSNAHNFGVNTRAHSEPLFSSLCVLSVMYKYHHGLLPNILDMFEQNSTIHQYYTRQSNLLHVPSCQTELRKKVC